jgi:hypothetical protein
VSDGLHLDIDAHQLGLVASELGATNAQVRAAISYACRRTATTLRTMAARALRDELQLRTIALMRKRLRSLRMRMRDGEGARLWLGLNDIPASWFQGRPQQTPAGAVVLGTLMPGTFVARSQFKGRLTVFKRAGKSRLHIEEQNLPVADRALVLIEDEIFTLAETVFWKNMMRDLRARVAYATDEWGH